MRVEEPLRRCWDKKKFFNKTTDSEKPIPMGLDDDFKPNAHAIDAVIKSKAFWSSVRALEELALEAEWMGRWSEGCPCHEAVLLAWASEQARPHRNGAFVNSTHHQRVYKFLIGLVE